MFPPYHLYIFINYISTISTTIPYISYISYIWWIPYISTIIPYILLYFMVKSWWNPGEILADPPSISPWPWFRVQAQMRRHPGIHLAGASWAATISVMNGQAVVFQPERIGKPWENHRKMMVLWWFTYIHTYPSYWGLFHNPIEASL